MDAENGELQGEMERQAQTESVALKEPAMSEGDKSLRGGSEDEYYEAILGAVMETARGRWFMAEFARRNRVADTAAVVDALSRLGTALQRRDPEGPDMRGDLLGMIAIVARARAEIAAPERDGQDGSPAAAGRRVDAVVRTIGYLESRLNAMLASWPDGKTSAEPEDENRLDDDWKRAEERHAAMPRVPIPDIDLAALTREQKQVLFS